MRRIRNGVLLWLSGKFSRWSYRLCDLSNTFSRLAAPPRKDWVPLNEFDRMLNEVLITHYAGSLQSSPLLYDKMSKAREFVGSRGFEIG